MTRMENELAFDMVVALNDIASKLERLFEVMAAQNAILMKAYKVEFDK